MNQSRGLIAAEVALGALTVAAVLGMGRLFINGEWFWAFLANALLAHLVQVAVRRRGLGLAAAAVATIVGGVLAIAWTVYPGTTMAGIPTSETLDLAVTDLADAWEAFGIIGAPVPVLPGFVVATAVALWFVAFVSDWAAFRLWVPFEATLSAGTLFVFTSMLGTGRGRGWATAVFAAALLAFLLLHRVSRQETTSHWVAGRAASGRRALIVLGATLAGVAVLAGVVIGPNLPGADAEPLVNPKGLTDDERRVTISPLVHIQSRLVEQADVEVFRVRSNRRAYWRLTALDIFDGQAWTSSGSYGSVAGDLPEGVPSEAEVDAVRQRFDIEALSDIWMPAAYEPRTVNVDGGDARFDEESGTLIVDGSRETSDALRYEVVSSAPRYTADELRQAPDDIPDEIVNDYTELPDDFSERVRAEALRITANAPTPYDKAMALQQHLRSFTYDLEVDEGHGVDDMEDFLFEVRRGYCEQFAGTFAAMARTLDLPARVAVGFTPGQVDSSDPDDPAVDDDPVTYIVRGENAHAWPEVYLEGYGWVLFEPTPSRGAPFAEAHTGVPESQVAPGDPTATSAPSTTAAPGDGTPTTFPSSGLETRDPSSTLDLPQSGGGDDGGPPWSRWIWFTVRWLILVPAAIAALYAGVLLVLHHIRRRRRRRPSDDPSIAVRRAWDASLDSLSVVGFEAGSHETHAEVAARARHEVPDLEEPLTELAELVEVASWSVGEPSEEEAARAGDAMGEVTTLVRARTTRLGRAVHAVKVETLLPPAADARRHVDASSSR